MKILIALINAMIIYFNATDAVIPNAIFTIQVAYRL